MSRKAAVVRVTGIVQGVGFRPFIYRVAVKLGITGYVKNLGGSEVEILVEGSESAVEEFFRVLKLELPPPAELEGMAVQYAEPRGYTSFKILESESSVTERSQIPPDIGICDECLAEVLDPRSRWYGYPFNSCAWCGPRFSMMYAAPYDRANTAMRDFPMCDDCLKEYSDWSNIRRFHAQGISCPKCGPSLRLLNSSGEEVPCKDPIAEAARLIDEGSIVAVRGLGGFHLAALASDDAVVSELRVRKRRPRKPLALMALNLDVVREIACPTEGHIRLLKSPQRPIVLIPKREGARVSDLVAPGLGDLGIMLPYTSLHYLLLASTRDKFLVMTSGNKPGLPICTGLEAVRELKSVADYFLLHNREIVNRVDDSVVRLTEGEPQVLRRARGYAPRWIKIPFKLGCEVVALGAHLSNAGAVAFDDKVVLTQYTGDMDYRENVDFLFSSLSFLEKVYGVKARAIVSDKHPGYSTTLLAANLAAERGVAHIKVQHHYAHIVSCMASNGVPLNEEVIGVAVDGAGYGEDGTVWGGEILLATYTGYKRLGHLDHLPLPGGDRATVYPARILAAALSLEIGAEEAIKACSRLGLSRAVPGGLSELVVAVKNASSSPKASSAGRFLDAVSVALGVCQERTYEGEPAIMLEAAARGGCLLDNLRIEVEGSRVLVRDFLVRLIDAVGKHSVKDLACTAQVRLGEALGLLAREASDRSNPQVPLAGGAAVNEYLIKGLKKVLRGILLPRGIPAGDGGIALGQAVVAGLSLSSI